jgi:predicted Zn-dependent protease
MQGGTSSTEAMIASTKRGFLVTRLSGMNLVDRGSLLVSGVTRDGLWLIEDGKVVKPVRNFRFIESPLVALNNIEDIGQAERVFHPLPISMFVGFTPHMILSQVIVPSIKVRDFSFTSTIDAI